MQCVVNDEEDNDEDDDDNVADDDHDAHNANLIIVGRGWAAA